MTTYAERGAAASEARRGESLGLQLGRDLVGGVMDLAGAVPGTLAAGAGAVGLDGAADALGGVAANLRAESAPGPYETLSGRGLLGSAVRTAPQLIGGGVVGGAVAASGRGAAATLSAFAGTQVAPVVGQSFTAAKQQILKARPDIPVDEANRLAAAKAATDGAVTFTTNMVVGPLVSKSPVGRWLVGTEAGKGVLGRVGQSALGRFGVAGLLEGSQEVTEWVGQEAAQAIIVDPSLPEDLRTAFQNAGPEALANFLVGGVLGGMANVAFEAAARAPRSGRADNSGPDQGLPVEDAPQRPDPGEPLAEGPSVQPADSRVVEDAPVEPVTPPVDGALPTDNRRVDEAPAAPATVEERASQLLARARKMGLQDGRDGVEPDDTNGLEPAIASEYRRAYRIGQREAAREARKRAKETSDGDRGTTAPPDGGATPADRGGDVLPEGRGVDGGRAAQERDVAAGPDDAGSVRAVAAAVEPVVGDAGVADRPAVPEPVADGVEDRATGTTLKDQRDAEIARLRADPVMRTLLMSEGAISPTQINRMGARAKEKWQRDAQQRMLNEARIRELSKTDEQIAADNRAAAEQEARKVETRDRARYEFLKALEPVGFKGISGSKKAYRAEYEKLRAMFDPPQPPAASTAPRETGGEGGITPGQRSRIGAVIAQAQTSGARNDLFADHTPVSDAEADRIGVLTGLDVRGYTHSIDVSGVRHALRGHANPAVERSRGQEPVTANDLLMVPSVVSNPDLVTPGPKTKSGLKTIIFKKRVNGHMLAVEEVRTGRKKLMLATMWKERAPGRVNARDESRPTANAQSVSPDGSTAQSIGQNPPEGKTAGENPQPGLFDRIESAARERIKKRRLPRKPGDRASGAGLIFEEIVDLAIIAAARVAKAGVAGYKAIRSTAAAVLEQRGEFSAEELRRVAKETGRIVRESGAGFAEFDRAVESAQRRKAANPTVTPPRAPQRRRLKQVIAEAAGVVDDADAKTVSERDALRAAMRAQVRAARAATRAEREAGNQRLAVRLQEIRWDRLTAQNARRKAAKLIRKHAPPQLAKRYLGFVASAKNEESATALYAKISADIAEYRMRLAKVEADSALRAAKPKKMVQELRDQVMQAKKDQARLMEQLGEARDAASKARELAAKIGDAQARADRMSEIAGELVGTINRLRQELVTKVVEVARQARATQRHWSTVLADGKARSREDVVAEQRQILEQVKDMPLQGVVKRDPEANVVVRFFRSMMNRDTIAAKMGDGPVGRMLTTAIHDGERRMMADEARGENARREILERHGYQWGSLKTRKLSALAEGDRAQRLTHKLLSGPEITATPAEWAELYAIVTDLDAREKILGGTPIKLARTETEPAVKLTRADVRFIERTVPAEVRKIVDELKADFQKNVSPGERASYREHFGYDMPVIEGYWHTRRRADKGGTTGLIGDYAPGAGTLATTSMWKDRVENPGKAPYLIGDAFATHAKMIREAAARTHLNQPVRALQVVLRDAGMQRDIRRKFGGRFFDQLALFAEQSAVILRPPPTANQAGLLGRTAQRLQRNLSRAFLAVSPSATLKNLGGAFKLVSVMPPTYLARAARDLTTQSGAVYQRMMDGSAFLRDRHGEGVAVQAAAQLGEKCNRSRPASNAQQPSRRGFAPIQCNRSRPASNAQPARWSRRSHRQCNRSRPASNAQPRSGGGGGGSECNRSRPASNAQPRVP